MTPDLDPAKKKSEMWGCEEKELRLPDFTAPFLFGKGKPYRNFHVVGIICKIREYDLCR
jgi:hypothetical protein